MALVLSDRVQETTTTTGTGTLTLLGATNAFQTFSAGIGNGNTTYYTIADSTNNAWEVGIGTVGAGTLSRDTVLASSTGSKLTLGAGTKNVWCDHPAKRSGMTTGIIENNSQINANYTITTGANAMSTGTVTVASGVTVTVPSGSRWVVI